MLARPEIGSKEHILLWLASKPPDEEFNWSTPIKCACGQYAYDDRHRIKRWADHPALCEMNIIAMGRCTFGTLYQAMRQKWS